MASLQEATQVSQYHRCCSSANNRTALLSQEVHIISSSLIRQPHYGHNDFL